MPELKDNPTDVLKEIEDEFGPVVAAIVAGMENGIEYLLPLGYEKCQCCGSFVKNSRRLQ